MSSQIHNILKIQHLERKREVDIEMEATRNLSDNAQDNCKDKQLNLLFSENEKIVSRALRPQILIAVASFFLLLSISMSSSHSSILIPQLKSENSSITVNDYTASWIASSYAIAGPLGSILGGIGSDIFGRKRVNVLGSVTMVAGWIVILMAQNNMLFIVARAIEGFCKGALSTSVLVTLDESADPKYRGLVFCCGNIGHAVGMVIMASLGATVDWWTASVVSTVLPIILLILCILIPETPTFLVRKHHIQEALNVILWYWGDQEVQAEKELQALISRFHPKEENKQCVCQERYFISKIRDILQRWRVILSPHVIKSFIIIHIFNIIQVTCGNGHFIFYSVEILSEARVNSSNNTMDPYISNVIITIVRLVFTLAAGITIFYVGRRPIALISGIGSSVSALIVTILLYVSFPITNSEVYGWIIFGNVILFNGFYNFGFNILPLLMVGETQAAEQRAFMTGYFFTTNEFILAAVIQNYYSMLNSLGIGGLFLMFGLSCLVCTVFVYFFLPETHGKSLLEIEAYFRQGNILWTTRKKYSDSVNYI